MEIVEIMCGRYTKVTSGGGGDFGKAVELRDARPESEDKAVAVMVFHSLEAGVPGDEQIELLLRGWKGAEGG